MAGRRAIRKFIAGLNTRLASCPRSRSRSLSPRTRSTRPSTPSRQLQKPDRSATARSSSSTSTMRFASARERQMPRHSDFALNLIHSGVKQMTFKRPYSAGLAALAVGLFAATAADAEPTVNKGENAWMLTSTVLVLLMTIPGLALFYGGLVRSKNMLSVLMQVFYTVCIVTVIWALYGYSLAFTGGSDFIGGFSKAFLMGVTTDSQAATLSGHAQISGPVYCCFQIALAAVTHQPRHRGPRRRAVARQAHRLRQGPDGSALADHVHDRRLAALGRLVRLQRRIEPRSQWRRSTRHDQLLRRDRGGGAVVDVRGVDHQGPSLPARRDFGRGGGPGCGRAGRRVRRSPVRAPAPPPGRRRWPL